MERGRKRNFESFSDNDDGENNSDDDENNSDDDDDGVNNVVDDHLIDDNAHVQLRRRIMSVICGLICVMNVFIVSRNLGAAEHSFLPVAMSDIENFSIVETEEDEIFLPAIKFQQDLWIRIIAMDQYCVDPTRKSEQGFWKLTGVVKRTGTKSTECLPLHSTR